MLPDISARIDLSETLKFTVEKNSLSSYNVYVVKNLEKICGELSVHEK